MAAFRIFLRSGHAPTPGSAFPYLACSCCIGMLTSAPRQRVPLRWPDVTAVASFVSFVSFAATEAPLSRPLPLAGEVRGEGRALPNTTPSTPSSQMERAA